MGSARHVCAGRRDQSRVRIFACDGYCDYIPGLNTRPAKTGDALQILATGLGAVPSPPADGANSLDALRATNTQPNVRIGGDAAQLQFSGLSPQFVGVNQLNVVVPSGAPTGNAAPCRFESAA
jgi:uncharacterized protein (TIGR03437 family)